MGTKWTPEIGPAMDPGMDPEFVHKWGKIDPGMGPEMGMEWAQNCYMNGAEMDPGMAAEWSQECVWNVWGRNGPRKGSRIHTKSTQNGHVPIPAMDKVFSAIPVDVKICPGWIPDGQRMTSGTDMKMIRKDANRVAHEISHTDPGDGPRNGPD